MSLTVSPFQIKSPDLFHIFVIVLLLKYEVNQRTDVKQVGRLSLKWWLCEIHSALAGMCFQTLKHACLVSYNAEKWTKKSYAFFAQKGNLDQACFVTELKQQAVNSTVGWFDFDIAQSVQLGLTFWPWVLVGMLSCRNACVIWSISISSI